MKKKYRKWIVIGIILIVVMVLFWQCGKATTKGLYSTATAETGDLAVYYSFSGNTILDETQHFISKDSWKIDEIKVKEGDTVKIGDVLYIINLDDYNLATASAAASVDMAKLGLNSTEASLSQQILQAKASKASAGLSLDDANKTLLRTKELYEAEMISLQNLEQSEMAANLAQEQYDSANQSYNLIVGTTSKSSRDTAAAQVNQAEVAYQTLVKNIGQREVTAEIDGIVSKVYANTGVTLTPGGQILDVINTNSMKATVSVDEYDYSSINVDKDVLVTISALDLEIPGKVSSVDRQATVMGSTSYFNVDIELNDTEGLLGGMSVEVKSLKDEVLSGILVPMEVIQFDKKNQPYVMYMDAEEVIQIKNVTIGINDGITAEIKEGVVAGETLYYVESSGFELMMQMGGN